MKNHCRTLFIKVHGVSIENLYLTVQKKLIIFSGSGNQSVNR